MLKSKGRGDSETTYSEIRTLGSIFSPVSGMCGYISMKHRSYSLPGPHDMYDIFRDQGQKKHFLKVHFSGRGILTDSYPSNTI